MLVNSGMTDKTVIYDEDMKINIADTSIEADYLQKMPVLKATGKNLFGGSLIATSDARRFELKGLELVEGEKYALSYNCSKDGAKTHQLQYMTNSTANPTYLSAATTNTSEHKLYFTVPKDLARLFIYTNDWNSSLEHFSNVQIEQGIQTTSYEPFKSNILSTNEEVHLCRFDDVQDELNLSTGELTKRIANIVLDGTEDWIADEARFRLYRDDIIPNKWSNGLSNHFIGNRGQLATSTDYDNYFAVNGYGLLLLVRDVDLFPNPREQLNEFKSWLSERRAQGNPVVLQYYLSQEVTKTVGISIVDQDDKPTNNLHTFDTITHINTYAQGGGLIPFVNIPENISYDTGNMLKPNTTYTLQINRKESNYPFVTVVGDKEIEVQGNKAVFTTLSTISDTNIKFYGKNNIISKVQLIEGDHSNVDIPYFEGMQSVKMPVLTTTGKNLNPTRIEPSGLYDSTGTNNNDSSHCRTDDFINVTPNQVLTVSSDQQINRIFGYDADGNYLGISNGGNILIYVYPNKKEHTFTVPNNCYKIKITSFVNTTTYFQLEEGAIATPYEPYKSNILSASEDVTLRGIDDVKDTLNCLTGEVTERIGEIVLDGSENWTLYSNGTQDNVIPFMMNNLDNKRYGVAICDKLKYFKILTQGNGSNEEGFISGTTGSGITVYISKDKASDIKTFKQWLSENPVTVQYQLATESIKTVDLSIIDQNGKEIDNIHTFDNLTHINTNSNGLIPYVDIKKEVSYESVLKPSTTYTLNFNQVNIGDEDLVINVGGTEVVYDGSENMTITTPSELLNNTISFYGKNHIVNNLVIVEGEEKINIYGYFTGMTNYKKESDKKSILIINNCPFVFGKGGRK
jgi:hypothetical protein